ncbi:MAG: cytochrome c family protein [Phenylobacterium sp.]|uniref:c-type cytochrome n=1 Tax=Phenylobacterium sp. TaxID=1871053 RepID=UPI001A3E0AC7|nr:cytochrome c family protein [Phenylobacterium sp.]MBL8770266.1 cytochrome c family protein [Phenylobacterium sp.]
MRLGPIAAATAFATLAAACSPSQPAADPAAADQASTAAAPTATPEISDEEKLKLLASLPAPYNAADLANGEAKFALCQSCHTITPGGANMTGPNLHGVFGKKAGTGNADFKYSDAVKNAGFVWDGPHLDQWLEKPQTFLPGTKMTFAGIKNPKDRTDLIAYLMVETGHGQK